MKAARRIARRARRVLRRERPIVLMYHRVETLQVDPWDLAVSPERFADQIRLLSASRTIVPLSWLAAEVAAGRQPRHTAAVTFDDGYIDVFEKARPILEAGGCPATVFIATGALGSSAGFWWDVLARIVLESPALPEVLEFALGGERHRVEVSDAAGARVVALMAIHARLRPATAGCRDRALAELASCVGTDVSARTRDLAMSADQAAEMTSSGLIEIGAHTVTHPPMTSLVRTDQVREAAESRRRCEEIAGRSVGGFAYPYGDFDDRAAAAVREAGFLCACSTVQGSVQRGTDAFAIPRVLAANWDEADFRRSVMSHG